MHLHKQIIIINFYTCQIEGIRQCPQHGPLEGHLRRSHSSLDQGGPHRLRCLVNVFHFNSEMDVKNSSAFSLKDFPLNVFIQKVYSCAGRSPGLVVMGGDSCYRGRGFESWHRILDGHFITYICCKNW